MKQFTALFRKYFICVLILVLIRQAVYYLSLAYQVEVDEWMAEWGGYQTFDLWYNQVGNFVLSLFLAILILSDRHKLKMNPAFLILLVFLNCWAGLAMFFLFAYYSLSKNKHYHEAVI